MAEHLSEDEPRSQDNPYQRLHLLEATADANIDGVTISDVNQPDAPLVYVNPGFERMTGYSAQEVIGRNCRFLQGSERNETALDEIRASMREHRSCRVTLRNFRKDGVLFWNELTLYPLRDEAGNLTHFVGIQRDVTERKRLEAQFLQAQRMDSIGRLVGGIAHDLGNLLVPVLIGSKMLQKRYADDEKTSRIISMIQQSGERGADMVKQVLSFARGVEGERTAVNPASIMKEVEKIVSETFPRNIDFRFDVSPACWMIDGDSTQLQQILVNLCVNARDAMSDGGRIDVTVENVDVDTSMAHMILGARTGSFVLLTVSDTGNGMPADILDKIFEPFFTTKAVGTGTGLGLSTVYNIVKSHSGFVTTYSEVGTGTTFRIYLPSSKSAIIQPDEPALVSDHAGHGRCVLIVDDEPVILEALSEALIDVGYEPILADGENRALQVSHKKELSAAIVDMMLAGEDGLSTIEKLLERDPELPVIAISGMGESMSEKASRAGAHLFLSKPFTALQLYDALDQALAKRA